MTTDGPSTTTAHDARGGATRRTLLSVLPLTTAWAGAAAVVAVPVVWTIVGAVVEQSPEGLTFIVLLIPVMLFAAIGALLYGFAAGALAALPDWFLRRRSPSAVGAVSSVVILTAIVSATFGCLALCSGVSAALPVSGWGWLALVAAATAAATSAVVARHRRRERRAAVTSLAARPA
ncbi:hypothetical protein ACRQ4C_13220 [Curtobacterium sp. SP.BCp]|uniref:hypothetical protein n=1 Tax=Curtobacterium sp. SP.BCp TaxID=3435230 RepID=UPI003F7357D3